jgi:hypothetical protein
MNEVNNSEHSERYLKLQNNGILLNPHKVALLHDILEHKNLKKHSTA